MPKTRCLTKRTAFAAARAFIDGIQHYPASRFDGRGIVICAGGLRYFACAWVCIKMLRYFGVSLPVEIWALGPRELDSRMRRIVAPLGVRCVDASEIRKRYPVRILKGWELKPYAILHSRFREVLLLDADNVPVANPRVLFGSSEYRRHGALFWPCFRSMPSNHAIWKICHVTCQSEPEFESGQLIVDKARCWDPLQLTMHLNENSDFYYSHIYGDKDTFHVAWRMLGREFGMIGKRPELLAGVACQSGTDGRPMFMHRTQAKWDFNGPTLMVPGFPFEEVCFDFLEELRRKWDGRISRR